MKTLKIHVLDDNNNPRGPVLCGKTSRKVLDGKLDKSDVLCHRCVTALLARVNEYADRIDMLGELLRGARDVTRRQQRLLDIFEELVRPTEEEPADEPPADDDEQPEEPADDEPAEDAELAAASDDEPKSSDTIE